MLETKHVRPLFTPFSPFPPTDGFPELLLDPKIRASMEVNTAEAVEGFQNSRVSKRQKTQERRGAPIMGNLSLERG